MATVHAKRATIEYIQVFETPFKVSMVYCKQSYHVQSTVKDSL